MRVPYHYNDADYLKSFRVQTGSGGASIYSGARRQRGGSILGTAFRFLSRYAFPVLKNLFLPATSIVGNAYNDVKQNKASWGDALKTSVKKELVGSGLSDLKRRAYKRKTNVLRVQQQHHQKKKKSQRKPRSQKIQSRLQALM